MKSNHIPVSFKQKNKALIGHNPSLKHYHLRYHGNKKNLQCVEQILFNKWHFIQKDDRTVTSSSTGRSIPLILAFILCMDIVSFVISTCKLSAVSYRSDDRALYILYKLIRKNIINIIASWIQNSHVCTCTSTC